eukprot:3182061-Rhodomonas_salina.3
MRLGVARFDVGCWQRFGMSKDAFVALNADMMGKEVSCNTAKPNPRKQNLCFTLCQERGC